jgi:diguanylate cyclase (GGDEF)-like protein/PAS domain S-box-containing protein
MNNMEQKAAIQSARLQRMLAASDISIMGSTLLAWVLAFIQYKVIPSSVVVTWFSAIVLVALYRFALAGAYKQSTADAPSAIHAWLVLFRVSVLATGVVWGSAGILLLPYHDTPHQLFLVLMLTGLTAGSVTAYSADLFLAIGYSLCALVPLAIRLFVVGGSLLVAMSVAVTLLLGYIVIILRQTNRTISENILLRIDAAAHEEIVKESEHSMRIAATAFESQQGMLIMDAKGAILRVNHAFTEITGYSIQEVVGKQLHLLGSDSHVNFYAEMWKTINDTGAWQGEIWNRRKNGESYASHLSVTAVKGSNGTVTNYVGALTDITQRKEAEEKIEHMAFYDHLTQLPNRRLLLDRLKQASASSSRSRRHGAILFIDLDNFKTLNDTLGHITGDILLQQVAKRLVSCVRECDTVARLGGDEFVVMLEELSEHALEAATQTEVVGDKILAELRQPYLLGTHEFRSTTSIGAALFTVHQLAIEELLKQADIAMYQAKKAGRNTLRFFDPQMQDAINARAALESDLREAIEKQQFELHYQIQVNSKGEAVGAEALIRWAHPVHGLVFPADFIPLAEETGLISAIGQWVLDTACAQLKTWQQDVLTRNLIIAANVSPKRFHQAEFVAQVRTAIERHAINPKLLKLELTESSLLEDVEGTIATMNALKEMGVKFSLDDFGTGFSSLQYLKRLPLDQLKIDQSFIRDLAVDASDKTIVRTIIAMAKNLNLDVIAEGVETNDQLQFILDSGCMHCQGFLFGKPVPIQQFEALLKQDGVPAFGNLERPEGVDP